jgi:hypothetical protein
VEDLLFRARQLSVGCLGIDRITGSLDRKPNLDKNQQLDSLQTSANRSRSYKQLISNVSLQQVLHSVQRDCFNNLSSTNHVRFDKDLTRLRRLAHPLVTTRSRMPEQKSQLPLAKHGLQTNSTEKIPHDITSKIKDNKTLENIIKHKRTASDLSARQKEILVGKLMKVGLKASNIASESDGNVKDMARLVSKDIKLKTKKNEETDGQKSHMNKNVSRFGLQNTFKQDDQIKMQAQPANQELSTSFYSKSEYAQDDEVLLDLYKRSSVITNDNINIPNYKRVDSQKSMQASESKSKNDSNSLDMEKIEFKPTSHKDEVSDKQSNFNDDIISQTSQNNLYIAPLPGGVFNRTAGMLLSPPPKLNKTPAKGRFASTKYLGNTQAAYPIGKKAVFQAEDSLKSSGFTDLGVQPPKLLHAATLGDSLHNLKDFKRQSSNPVNLITGSQTAAVPDTLTDQNKPPSVNSIVSVSKDHGDKIHSAGLGSDRSSRKAIAPHIIIKVTPPIASPSDERAVLPNHPNSAREIVELGGQVNNQTNPSSKQARSHKRLVVDLTVPKDTVINETEEEHNRTTTYISVKESGQQINQNQTQLSGRDLNETSQASKIEVLNSHSKEQNRTKPRYLTEPLKINNQDMFERVPVSSRKSKGTIVPKIRINYAEEDSKASVNPDNSNKSKLVNTRATGELGSKEQRVLEGMENIQTAVVRHSKQDVRLAHGELSSPEEWSVPISESGVESMSGPLRKASLGVPDHNQAPDYFAFSGSNLHDGPTFREISSPITASFGKLGTQPIDSSKLIPPKLPSLDDVLGERRIIKKVAEFPRIDLISADYDKKSTPTVKLQDLFANTSNGDKISRDLPHRKSGSLSARKWLNDQQVT